VRRKFNNVSGLVLTISLITLVSSTTAFAAQKINSRGSAWSWWGSTTAAFNAEYAATNQALANLNTKARKKCPNGYRVLAGPFCSASHKLKVTNKNGKYIWPWYQARARCSAKIECNTTNQFPNFHQLHRDPRGSREDLYSKSLKSINYRYELLASVKDPETLSEFVSEWESTPYDRAAFEHDLFEASTEFEISSPSYDELVNQAKSLLFSMHISIE
jgi:hypothetical protein